VPPVPFGLVQADLFEHGDPFFYVHMLFHMSICVTILLSVQFCHGHDRETLKCEAIDGSRGYVSRSNLEKLWLRIPGRRRTWAALITSGAQTQILINEAESELS
jgi:hypothetical protein